MSEKDLNEVESLDPEVREFWERYHAFPYAHEAPRDSEGPFSIDEAPDRT